jgi:flagellar basal-body rod protein FlgF
MDRLIYTAMTGASHALVRQDTVAQNLANASTPGFKAAINAFRAVPLTGDGLSTRTFVVDSTVGADMSQGPIQSTGRNLDVAVNGNGWIAVKMPDGSEAYTRNGSLQVSPNGILQTRGGLPVASDSGTITVPPNSEVTIAKDGTLSTVPTGNQPLNVTTIGRIKLVNPPQNQLVRGEDGLFRTVDGSASAADSNVTLTPASLEGSNANPVDAMVNMVTLARQYEMQMKLLQSVDTNEQKATGILTVS